MFVTRGFKLFNVYLQSYELSISSASQSRRNICIKAQYQHFPFLIAPPPAQAFFISWVCSVEKPCGDTTLNRAVGGRVSLLAEESFISAIQLSQQFKKAPEVGWLIPLPAKAHLYTALSCVTSWSQAFHHCYNFWPAHEDFRIVFSPSWRTEVIRAYQGVQYHISNFEYSASLRLGALRTYWYEAVHVIINI